MINHKLNDFDIPRWLMDFPIISKTTISYVGYT